MQEQAKKLYNLRKKINEIKDTLLKPLEEERDAIQNEVLDAMKASNEFSVRYDFATVTRAVRKTPKVTDENAVMEYLKEKGLDDYISPRLNSLFDGYAKAAMKANEQVQGLAYQETEYISLKEAVKDERRKVTTDPGRVTN